MRIAALIVGLMLPLGAATAALGDERLAIPASRFSMEVPESFSLGQGFAGYEDLATKSRILIVEFPPGMAASSYKDFKPLFDDLFIANSNFADQGMMFDLKDTITTRDGNALPVIAGIGLKDGQAFERWMMLSGPEAVALILFTMLEGNELPDETVRTILSSLEVAPELSLAEQLAALPFGVDAADPLSRIDVLSGAGVALTEKSFALQKSSDPLVVLGWQVNGTAATDPAVLAEQLLRGNEVMKPAVVEEQRAVTFAGADGYRIVGSVDFKGTPTRFIQYTALIDGRSVRLMATTPIERADELFPIFETIAGSVRQQQ
jgi:hypothetical protein